MNDHFSKETPSDLTRERLIEAATSLLIERGFDFASVREITLKAGTNLAAVNYHFGCKDNLMQAVLWRHLQPLIGLRQERLAALRARCEAESRSATFDEVVDAWLDPALERIQQQPETMGLIDRMVRYLVVDRQVVIQDEILGEVNRVLRDFAGELPQDLVRIPQPLVMGVLLRASQLLVGSTVVFGMRDVVDGIEDSWIKTPWPLIKENLKSFVRDSLSGAESGGPRVVAVLE